jgi:hypothetical protein
MVNRTEYFVKIMVSYLGQCHTRLAWQDWLPEIQLNHATNVYYNQYSIDLQYDLLFWRDATTLFHAT